MTWPRRRWMTATTLWERIGVRVDFNHVMTTREFDRVRFDRVRSFTAVLDPSVVGDFCGRTVRRMFRVLSLGLVVADLGLSGALACYSAGSEVSVFFKEEDLVDGIDAPTMVDVTIISVSASADNTHWVGNARIKRVVKGSIDADLMKVLVFPSSCGPRGFGIGASGIVIGALRRDVEGALALTAVQESFDVREERRTRKGK